MKTYDIIFSLGYGCAISQGLRDLGRQVTSYPLDWVASDSPLMGARMIDSDFKDWFKREDLKLWDIRYEGGHIARNYKNVRTGFGFAHEFTNAETIDETYDACKDKYDRRIARFMRDMRAAKSVLAVYLEEPRQPRASEADLKETLRILRAKFPSTKIELLYIFADDACVAAEEIASQDDITVVKAHYRTYLNGQLMHIADRTQVVAYLKQKVTIVNAMTDDELRAMQKSKREKYMASLGKTRLEQWFNKKLKQWYRDLEVYLIGQKLMPGDRPRWFDGDGK